MKKTLLISAALIACICAGCSGGSSDGSGAGGMFPIAGMPAGTQSTQNPVGQDQGGIQTPTASSGYTGSWQHTYEYFDTQYHTTLVINGDGSAVYYNDDPTLGNFSASWYDTGNGISISRSDGVQSTAVIQNGMLIETSYEDGNYYQAEYYRA